MSRELASKNYEVDTHVLSGSDLSVFYLSEQVDLSEWNKGATPIELLPKRLTMMEFDSVLSLTYSTLREKFPVRSLGEINAKAITYGIRTISGTIAFSIFAEDVLSRLRGKMMNELNKELPPSTALILEPTEPTAPARKTSEENEAYLKANQEYKMQKEAFDIQERRKKIISSTILDDSKYKAVLLDQLPPFHLIIMGTNERGILASMMIKGVSIIDETQIQGTAQPHIINKVSFVATDIIPLTKKEFNSVISTGSMTSIQEANSLGNLAGNSVYENLGKNVPTSGATLLEEMRLKSVADYSTKTFNNFGGK